MSSEPSSDEGFGSSWDRTLRRIRGNDPRVKSLVSGSDDIQNLTDEEWEELGRDISNNTHLINVDLSHAYELLNDHKMSCLFRGLTRSSTKTLNLDESGFGVAGLRSMVPFLQNTNSLTRLDIDSCSILAAGFNMLFRALSDSPIERLYCCDCCIDSIEIDSEHKPKHLKTLFLAANGINADGCRQIAKLLQGGDATLKTLNLEDNNIDDEGVGILVSALQSNKSLETLDLELNSGISRQGQTVLLKLVNDISSIEATLQSNHTLTDLSLSVDLDRNISIATETNAVNVSNPEAAGREKMIHTQLHSERRAELAALQGVKHSVYSEIDPLHLPEVLVLVGRHHGQGELYIALRSSIAGVISTVNRKECLKQQSAYYEAKMVEFKKKMEAVNAEIAVIEASEESTMSNGSESRSSKKRRAC